MKRSLFLALTPLLLAGCVNTSATYYIDGAAHSITLRAEQAYFWNDEVEVKMVAARTPDCQRVIPMTTLPAAEIDIQLFNGGDGVYSVRIGKEVMRIETQTCTRLPEPSQDELGERLGAFKLDAEDKMVFEKEPAAPAAPGSAAAPAN